MWCQQFFFPDVKECQFIIVAAHAEKESILIGHISLDKQRGCYV